jgi:regulator of RNase E activity RraB
MLLILGLWLVGCKKEETQMQENTQDSTVPEQEDRWECYLFQTKDGPVSNFVNLDADKRQDGLPIRYLVKIRINEPREHGFPTKDEDTVLWELEDVLEKCVHSGKHGYYVGRSTHAGQRTFCYYMRNESTLKETDIENAIARFAQYVPQCTRKYDDKWEYYHDYLYPSPEEMQCIQNRMVVDSLVKNGDSLESPRETDHWIYFSDPSQRNRYRDETVALGFKTREERRLDDGRYCLQIHRVDKVDYRSINNVVLTLFRLAEKYNGEYDGWETFVVKENTSEQLNPSDKK